MFGFSISYLFYRYGIRKENAEDDSSKRIFLENKIVREMKTDPLLEFLISIPYFILLFFFFKSNFRDTKLPQFKDRRIFSCLIFRKKILLILYIWPKTIFATTSIIFWLCYMNIFSPRN